MQQPALDRSYRYKFHEMPRHYTYSKRDGWVKRAPQYEAFPAVGRMFHVRPSQGELYFLRLLLAHVRGPTGFGNLAAELKHVNGVAYDTYREAAVALGLTRDDQHVHEAMQEGCTYAMPAQLRQMFALFLAGSDVQRPRVVWDAFKSDFVEDEEYKERRHLPGARGPLSADATLRAEHVALRHIDKLLRFQGSSLSCFADLPQPPAEAPPDVIVDELRRWDRAELQQRVTAQQDMLNRDQRNAYDAVVAALAAAADASVARAFFFDR